MKQIKLALITSLFVMGIFATFAFKPAETTSFDDVLYWYDASGTTLMDPTPVSKDDRISVIECKDQTLILCERGYRADQFNNPGVPSSGINPLEFEDYVPINESIKP